MKAWLAYTGGFVCALGFAVPCFLAVGYALLLGVNFSVEVLVLLVFIFPPVIGLIVFRYAYKAFAGRRFGLRGWGYGAAFVAVGFAVLFGFIGFDVLPKRVFAATFVVIVYLGGLVMAMRARDE